MEYLIHDKGEQRGPYTEQQVRNMWANGSLTSATLYWTDGALEWMPLVELCEPKRETESVSPALPQTESKVPNELLNPKVGTLYSVFCRNYPRSNGTFLRTTIDSQQVDVHKTSGGSLALKYSEGMLFKSHHVVVLARDTKEIGRLPDTFTQTTWKQYLAKKGSGGGNLLLIGVTYAIQLALAKADGVAGIYLHFTNEEGGLKQVVLLGDARLIDNVVASELPSRVQK